MRALNIPTLREFASLVAEATLRDGGATVNPLGRRWLTTTPDAPCYVVGHAHNTATIKVDVRAFGPNSVYAALTGPNVTPGTWVGTWVDNGTVHIDLVDLWTDRDAALRAAETRLERAVYAAHTGETIWTPGNDPNSPEAWARAVIDAVEAPDTGPSDFEDPAALMAEDEDSDLDGEYMGTARNGRPYDTRYDCHICGREGGH
jgi:hypothetical protein